MAIGRAIIGMERFMEHVKEQIKDAIRKWYEGKIKSDCIAHARKVINNFKLQTEEITPTSEHADKVDSATRVDLQLKEVFYVVKNNSGDVATLSLAQKKSGDLYIAFLVFYNRHVVKAFLPSSHAQVPLLIKALLLTIDALNYVSIYNFYVNIERGLMKVWSRRGNERQEKEINLFQVKPQEWDDFRREQASIALYEAL